MGQLEKDPGQNGEPLESIDAKDGKSYSFTTGSGVGVSGNVSVANDLYAGYPGVVTEKPGEGFVYISSSVNSFTMSIGGTLTVNGTVRAHNNINFSIKGYDENGGTISSAQIGNIDVESGSTLSITDVNNFEITGDSITNKGNLTISAETIASLGAVDIQSSGETKFEATGEGETGSISMDSLIASGGGTTTLTATGSINSDGNIQNGYTSDEGAESGKLSTMNITATSGDLDVGGDLENSGNMTVTVGNDVTVTGTMKNDSNAGSLTMNLSGGLTVSGGDTGNPSFVNKGNLSITATGAVSFAHGLSLSGMKSNNTFSLKAQSLSLGGDGDDSDNNLYVSNLNSFTVELSGGDIKTKSIVNGNDTADDDLGGEEVNTNAQMGLTATNITAERVENNGKSLTMSASKDITISSTITGNNGETDIQATGKLDVNGTITNNTGSKMRLNGQTVELTSVNNYGDLDIVAPTEDNPNGTISIQGPVNNYSGDLLIESKSLTITGAVTNSAGTTTIKGSDTSGDSIQIGSISNTGGVFNLESWTGGVNITNGLSITGGVLNAGASLATVTAGNNIDISGDVKFGTEQSTGDGDLNIVSGNTAGLTLKSTSGNITIGGNITTEADTSGNHGVAFEAKEIKVGSVGTDSGNVTATDGGSVTFGATENNSSTTTTIYGDVAVSDGGSVTFNSGTTTLGSLTAASGTTVNATGTSITANDGDINISGDVRFNDSATGTGFNIKNTSALTLKTTQTDADITLSGNMNIVNGKTLTLDSADMVTLGGTVTNAGTLDIDAEGTTTISGTVTNNGNLTVDATSISMQDLTNSKTAKLNATAANITARNITNSGDMTITSSGNITTDNVNNSNMLTMYGAVIASDAFTNTSGTSEVTASDSFSATSMYISGGTVKLGAPDITVTNAVTVTNGNLTQGGTPTDGLYLASDGSFSTGSLNVSGNFNAYANTVNYDVENSATFTGNINVDDGAAAELTAGQSITAADLTNNGQLTLTAENGITLQDITNESGELGLNSGTMINATTFTNNTGALARLTGTGMNLTGAFESDGAVYHNMPGATAASGDVSITGDDYTINASNVTIGGFNQNDGTLTFNTSDFTSNGDIHAVGLNIVAVPDSWLTAVINGSIYGGTSFLGLEHMDVHGNYVFDNNSRLSAAILPYAAGGGENSSTRDYWASVSLNNDNTLGRITNHDGAQALVEVDGKFITDVDVMNALPDVNVPNNSALPNAQMGITLYDIVDQGTAIWLIHASEGLSDLATKARNLNVSFCNADGTICINYLDAVDSAHNGTGEDLGAYLSARDTDGDGYADSLYVVFDPRFGGPVEVFKIQPVVDRVPDHTQGEYETAGGLDDLIEGQLHHKGFFNRTPIEVIPEIFKGTNMAEMSQELYNRMEQYVLERDGTPLARFSRLFQPREVEQLAGSVILNEHTNYRSFEDHMIDEFIWNRNRNLRKAWGDFEFGIFSQDLTDAKRTTGNRFNITGGYDWQQSDTLIVGVTARLSHMAADNSDAMDLGYMPNQPIAGHVNLKVADTDLGLGAYMMQTLGQKTRLYGNGYLDIHFLDVSRDQNYVAHIDGDGTAFSITSEWGLLHDWLNQYIVGNMYARLGYNFGFSVTEEAAGGDYMDLESDGYFIVTPGYSLTAQKRIYPSVWLQLRPYATIGIEYDVLGSPESVKFKFAPAERYTKYDIDINPLWANIGGGIEVLSAKGIQVGLDYRYQYNEFIQIHNIKLSGSYRF